MSMILTALLPFIAFFLTRIAQQVFQVSNSPLFISGSVTGSLNGGSILYLKGAGFDMMDNDNQVFVGSFPCIVKEYFTTETFLACQMPESTYGTVDVTLVVTVYIMGQSRTCSTVANCQVRLLYDKSPNLKAIVPQATVTGKNISLVGYFVASSSDGIKEVKIGKYNCVVDEELVKSLTSSNRYSAFQCRVPDDIPAGDYTMTVTAAQGTGYASSFVSSFSYKVGFSQTTFHIRIHASLKDVSSPNGFVDGQVVTLSGNGFGTDPAKVSVAYKNFICKVLEVTNEKVKCELEKDPATDTSVNFIGGSGLEHRFYKVNYAPATLKSRPSYPDNNSPTISVTLSPENQFDLESYSQRMLGLFYAPTTGTYTFYLSSDDQSSLRMSSTPFDPAVPFDESQLTEICSISAWTQFRSFYQYSTQKCTIDLTASKYYYILALHTEGGGADHLSIGVSIPNTDATQPNTKPAVKKLTITNTPVREVFTYKLYKATAGTYKIRFYEKDANGKIVIDVTTAAIAYNASATTVTNAIRGVTGFNLACTRVAIDTTGAEIVGLAVTDGYKYTCTVNSYRSSLALPFLLTESISGNVQWSAERLTSASPPVQGSFMLQVDGVNTVAISPSIDSASLMNVLVRLPKFALGVSVSETGDSNDGKTWYIRLDSLKDSPAITIVNNLITGGPSGSPAVLSIDNDYELPSNDLYYMPIPSDLLFNFNSAPEFRVKVGDYYAACVNKSCGYTVLPSSRSPIVSSFSFSNQNLLITLDAGYTALEDVALLIKDNLSVTFSKTQCAVTDVTLPVITCLMPKNSDNTLTITGGSIVPKVHLINRGFFAVTAAAQAFPFAVTSVAPSSGSIGGNTPITIVGTGFSTDTVVKVNGNACKIVSATNIQIVCNTPAQGSTNLAASIVLNDGDLITTADGLFSYNSALTPTITALTPDSASPVLKSNLVITASGLGSTIGDLEVTLVGALKDGTPNFLPCTLISLETTSLTCRLGGGPSGDYRVFVNRKNAGDSISDPVTANKFTYKITVTAIDLQTGSKAGGQIITITGTNFSTILNQNQVLIGTAFCQVTAATTTQLTAVVPAIPEAETVEYPIYVIGRVVEEALCDTTVCKFTYSDDLTPTVTAMTPLTGAAGTSVTITGKLLSVTGIVIKLGSLTISTDAQTAATAELPSSATFTIPAVAAFNSKLSVFVPGNGNALINPDLLFANVFSVADIMPKTGTRWGNYLTITGNGFDVNANVTVKIGANVCAIKTITVSTIVCWFDNLSAYTTAFKVNVYLKDVLATCTDCSYTTIASVNSPRINALGATSFTTPDSITFTISGTLLGDGTTATAQLISRADKKRTIDGTISVVGTVMSLTFNTLQVGDYKLVYKVNDVGFAWVTTAVSDISVLFQLTDFSDTTVQVSYAGGLSYTVTAKGFVEQADVKSASVLICGNAAKITSTTFNSLTFTVPALLTSASNTLFELAGDKQINPINISTLDNASLKGFINDGNFTTIFTSNSNSCFVTYDYGENFKAQVSKIQMFPFVNMVATTLAGAQLQGSDDNVTWTTLTTIPRDVVSNWNSYFPPTDAPLSWKFRYIRFFGNLCRIAELNVYGVVYRNGGDGTSDVCNIDITMNSKAISLASKVEYRSDKTASITSITPKLGTTAGGTVVTIIGTGFDPATTTVKFDDITCVVNQAGSTTTSIVCTTGARPTFVSPTVVVATPNGRASTRGLTYLYIDRWSDSATWNGESFPREGDSVYVPVGQNLLIDITPPRIYSLIVEGSVIWADESDLEFRASFIVVKSGVLQIGTRENPHSHKLTVTLYGNVGDKQLPIVGNKHISVNGGQIDIHGMPKTPTWTLLGASVTAGSTEITLTEAVNWQVGDEIVIASTSFNRDEFERRFITAISADTKTLTLDTPLNHAHFGESLTYDSNIYEVRAEVACLTRNVRVFGDDTTLKTQYGAHIMMMGRDSGLRGRISYLEMTKCGQAFQMGRYPIHFHMAGNVIGSYIEGCSVHDSFNRGSTVHGVHFLTVKNNVYLNHMGHGIFIEDSVETNNVIEGNLVMRTTQSASLLISDLKPAAIWITHPRNFIRYNHAAGSTHFGFWFDLPGNPTGPSATTTVCPSGEPLGQFHHNVAHTNGIGLRVYPIYIPRTKPCEGVSNSQLVDPFSSNPSVIAEFTDNLFFGNSQGFFGRNIGAIQLKRVAFISNGMNAVVAEPDATNLFTPRIEDSVFVGKVDSWHALQGMQSGGAFGTGRRDGFLLKNIKFIDFPASSTMFRTCEGCADEMHRDIGARQTNFEGLTFTNVLAKMIDYNDANRDKDILRDTDGSLIKKLGIPTSTGGWIVPYFKHLDVPGCTAVTDTSICSEKCLICDNTLKIRRVNFRISGTLFDGLDLKVLNYAIADTMNVPANFEVIKFRSVTVQGFKGWAIPFATSFKYNLHWTTGLDFDALSIDNSLLHEASDPGFFFRTNNTYQRELYDGKFKGMNLGYYNNSVPFAPQTAAPTTANYFGDYYYTNTTNTTIIRVDGNRIGTFILTSIICRLYCPVDPGATVIESDIRLWSSRFSWTSGVVPVAGDLVVIEAGWNMILDVDTPILSKLTIRGQLSFSTERPATTLSVRNIDIASGGYLRIGNFTNPYLGQATILLIGDRTDPQIIIDPLITPVVKGIAVKGQFIAYGTVKTPVTARLSSTVLKGATTIILNQDTNWVVGDQLVIAASSRKPDEVDYVTIASKLAANSFTVTPALLYDHYGAATPITTNGLRTLDMRAEVSVLTRNIVIKGTNINNWGCRILAAGYENTATTPAQVIRGVLDLNNVEVNYCGQKDTEQAAIDFQGVDTSQRVIGCSIRNGLGWGINMQNSKNIFIDNNIITNQTKTGVHLKNSQNVVFQNNVITKINIRADYFNIEFFDLIFGFYYNDQRYLKTNNVVIKNNIISSVNWFAWAVPGYQCSEDSSNFFNNTGHTARAGWFGLKSDSSCMKYSDFIGYHNFDEGFAQRFGLKNLIVTRMLFADNNNSISINGGDAADAMFPTSTFTNSEIYGHVLKDCSFCYKTLETCQTSGLYTSLFETKAFVMEFEENRLPLHNVTDTSFLWGGIQSIRNVNFSDFRTTEVCSKNFPIRANNFIQDTSAFVNLTNIRYFNVDYSNTIFFFNHTRPKNSGFCAKRDCTGIYNLIVADNTGSIFGRPTTFFGFNKPAGRDGNCTFETTWNGHSCNPVYSLLSIQQPEQARPVVITPLTVSLYAGRVPNVSEDLQYLNTVDNERKIPVVVKKFGFHNLSMQGTMPNNVIYKLDSDSPTDWAVFRIQHLDPSTMITLVNDVRIAPKIVKEDQSYDFTGSACGDHVYFPSNRTIIFYVNAQPSCLVKVQVISSLQLSVRINIAPADFYKNTGVSSFIDNISALLGIPTDRIRIVGILTGSTIINFVILPPVTAAPSGSSVVEEAAHVEEFTKFQDKIVSAIETGTVDLGGKVLNIDFATTKAPTVTPAASPNSDNDILTVCRYYSTTNFTLMNIHTSSYSNGNGAVDIMCTDCIDISQCKSSNLINACYHNITAMGQANCTRDAYCPYHCKQFSEYAHCRTENGVKALTSVTNVCSEICVRNGTFSLNDFEVCHSSNCTIKCNSYIQQALIMLVVLLALLSF